MSQEDYIENGTEISVITDRNKIEKAYMLGRSVKFLAFIDLIFALMNGLIFNNIYLSLIALLPFSGYYGAKKYSICYTSLYQLFIILTIISRIALMYYYKEMMAINLVFNIIFILTEVWISWLICQFIDVLSSLTALERSELIEERFMISQVYFVYY